MEAYSKMGQGKVLKVLERNQHRWMITKQIAKVLKQETGSVNRALRVLVHTGEIIMDDSEWKPYKYKINILHEYNK